MRISDWSSDVCSSDLAVRCAFGLCSNGCLVALVVGFHIAPLCAEACAARSRRAVVRLLVGLDAHFARADLSPEARSEEHTSELQSLMRISYAVFCLKKKKKHRTSQLPRRNQTT